MTWKVFLAYPRTVAEVDILTSRKGDITPFVAQTPNTKTAKTRRRIPDSPSGLPAFRRGRLHT